jgi:hypothetical protein
MPKTSQPSQTAEVQEQARDGFPIMSQAQFDLLIRYINLRAEAIGGIMANRDASRLESVFVKAELRRSLVHGAR